MNIVEWSESNFSTPALLQLVDKEAAMDPGEGAHDCYGKALSVYLSMLVSDVVSECPGRPGTQLGEIIQRLLKDIDKLKSCALGLDNASAELHWRKL